MTCGACPEQRGCRVCLGVGSLLSVASLADGQCLAAVPSDRGLLPVLSCLPACLQAAVEDTGSIVHDAVTAGNVWAAETGTPSCTGSSCRAMVSYCRMQGRGSCFRLFVKLICSRWCCCILLIPQNHAWPSQQATEHTNTAVAAACMVESESLQFTHCEAGRHSLRPQHAALRCQGICRTGACSSALGHGTRSQPGQYTRHLYASCAPVGHPRPAAPACKANRP